MQVETTNQPVNQPGQLREFWYYFRENRGAVIGLAFFAVFVFVAMFAPLIAPLEPI